MMQLTPKYKHLHFINFKNVTKWYVSYYINPYSIASSFPLVRLKELIYPIQDKIRLKEFDGKTGVVKKISFADGKIHLRDENKTRMDLYKLYKNDLLVSKINFHQGAISLNNIGDLVCTTHYQPYRIDNTRVLPEYLVFVLRSKTFLNFIDYLRAEGIKNEATYEFIGNLDIPLPPLNKQIELVEIYNNQIELASKQEIERSNLESIIETRISKLLGINVVTNKINKGITVFKFKDITKWSVDYILKQGSLSGLKRSLYSVIPLGQIIDYLQYGISEKSTVTSNGTAVLRMNNIQNRKIDSSNLKYYDFKTSRLKKNKVILQKGDLLFNRTNSKELVGKTAVFDLDGEFTFASYLIRLRFNKNANTYFINYLLNSQIGRIQMDLISRQILGQANINSEELKGVLIPLPPLEIQNDIVKELDGIVLEQEKLLAKSIQNKEFAIQHFEQSIFNL